MLTPSSWAAKLSEILGELEKWGEKQDAGSSSSPALPFLLSFTLYLERQRFKFALNQNFFLPSSPSHNPSHSQFSMWDFSQFNPGKGCPELWWLPDIKLRELNLPQEMELNLSLCTLIFFCMEEETVTKMLQRWSFEVVFNCWCWEFNSIPWAIRDFCLINSHYGLFFFCTGADLEQKKKKSILLTVIHMNSTTWTSVYFLLIKSNFDKNLISHIFHLPCWRCHKLGGDGWQGGTWEWLSTSQPLMQHHTKGFFQTEE